MADAARRDVPTIDDATRPFWDAAKERRFLIVRCNACGVAHHYPRPFCPACWSDDVVWEDSSGRGSLYTWSTVHVNDMPPFSERLPYVAAVVELEEGPKVMTNIVGCDPRELAVGMPVVVDFEPLTEEITVPVFRPA